MAEKNPTDIQDQDVNSITDTHPKKSLKNKIVSKLRSLVNIKKFILPKPLLEKLSHFRKNKKLFFSTLAVLVVLIAASAALIVLKPSSESPLAATKNPLETAQKNKEEKIPQIPKLETKISDSNSKSLDSLIKKANILYNSGQKNEALDIFNNIASFSQAIANHNLGVIKLKEKQYPQAITSFDNAIASGENISISALDGMVSAYYLGDANLYKHYLKLLNTHLPDSAHQPFYSYLYSLAQYYNGYYFESLSSLINPNSNSFEKQNHRLAAKTFLIFNDDYNALLHLQESATPQDSKALGMLYARVGEYQKAKNYLYGYFRSNPKDLDSLLALQIIELKSGNLSSASSLLDSIAKNKDLVKKAMQIYPIKVTLNDSLFDVNLAQEEFWNRSFEIQDKIPYKIIFYYAPFRVFNAKEALKVIQKGELMSDISNIQEAKESLMEGSSISTINKSIIQALIDLDGHDIRKALQNLAASTKSNPNHPILHYNLGLIYAQMGDFEKAYTHFLRAYHLDSNDITSGLFAIIAGSFTYQDTSRIMSQISRDFENVSFQSQAQKEFLSSFIGYLNNNINDGLDWINAAPKKYPIYYALKAAYGIRNKDKNELIDAFSRIKDFYPKDVVSNILYELAYSYDINIKQMALRLHNLFLSTKLDLTSLYYGGAFTRELYVYIGFITGSLQSQETILENKLISQDKTPNGILQAIALISIYQHKFEKAYTIYNTLIEDLKEDDSQTKFFGAVAAIGANHPENAALLLQLAKMGSSANYESRYALALLYQSSGDFQAASTLYSFISPVNFKSEFFDFNIDTSEIKAAKSQ